MPKNKSIIFISPLESPKISLICNNDDIDFDTSYTLIPDELPINVNLIIKREISKESNKTLSNYYLILTSKDFSGNISNKKFRLKKNVFGKIFSKKQNDFYPMYY